MKNILVSVDFDKKTRSLLDNALPLAEKFNSKIWILHTEIPDHFTAIPVPGMSDYEIGPQYNINVISRTEELKDEHKIVQGYVEELMNKGILAEELLIEEPTVKMILDEAAKINIDLIIIGSHKHSFIYNALFGDTSSDLIKKSNIPLLVIPLD